MADISSLGGLGLCVTFTSAISLSEYCYMPLAEYSPVASLSLLQATACLPQYLAFYLRSIK
jgi:hypothetical protein